MIPLTSEGTYTTLIKDKGVLNWEDACAYIASLPYGRNTDRSDFSLVLTEGVGSCSSKHAVLKHLAEENDLDHVQLILGVYKMDSTNTQGIGDHIHKAGLSYLPEAHCYLKLNGSRVDYTTRTSNIQVIANALMEEQEITPEQVISYKVNYHQSVIKDWIKNEEIPYSFEQIWAIRERCIAQLSQEH